MPRMKMAAMDLGTVSSRMLCAEMDDGDVLASIKRTVITDLGEGVDATGVFAPAAIERVVAACAGFVCEAKEFGAEYVGCTLTSAARDVSNGEDLLGRLREIGLIPQVIPGDVEARLTFYGVAHDFMGERIAVADSGGGSTELVVGRALGGQDGPAGAPRVEAAPQGGPDLRAEPCLELERALSLDIGCRRVTERFFGALPPSRGDLDRAAAWMRPLFEGYWKNLERRPERLVAVGGTVTSLVAMVHGLAVYDSSFVHLRDLAIADVETSVERMSGMTVDEIAELPGIQAKRAPVILAGALIVRELMRAGGYDRLTVSENSLLVGAAATMYESVASGGTVIGWMPRLSTP